MKRISIILGLLLIVLTITSCSRENKTIIEKNRVGLVCSQDLIGEIETIFANDSIVKNLSEGALGGGETKYVQDNDEYLVYSKQGKHLMTIVPNEQHDSASTIKYVQIVDPQFKSDKGLSLSSSFKDINVNYMINKVETSLSSATLYIDELNATIALDKKEIGVNPFSTQEIKIEQIPDMAKIKYLTIWFD
ncbi:MAG: hypothetical protein BM563_07495 [Bacteroidetes bacterium MedPE-SWsnd-G1]|mgnify:FL=1|nr:MAG: hypothetical protein BM563_07495 [Bacteroidetes bacterium MedPE-SWsnd-G1]